MGVTGLWNLIEDSGTKVNVETLHGKVLAIDLSIWIHQAIKGFRDKNGKAVENAHILGLFHRVCKLLFYNIKPIFVFDGNCPTLKSRTIAKRNEKMRKALTKSKNMSFNVLEKYVNSQLGDDDNSAALLAAAKNKLRLSGSSSLLSELFLPPKSESKQVDIYQEFVELNKQICNKVNDSDSDEFEAEDDLPKESGQSEDVSFHIPNCQNIRDIDINSEQFRSLPATTRYEILIEMRESYKGRKNPFPEMLPSDSDVFSQYQMSKLLKKRNLQEEIDKLIDELNGANNEDNIELLRKSSSMSAELLAAQYQQISSGRLASDEHTRFLLFKTSLLPKEASTPGEAVADKANDDGKDDDSEADELRMNSQNFAYTLPNSVTDSSINASGKLMSGLSRIEHLSQASTSSGFVGSRFQSKQLVDHLNSNMKRLTKSEGTLNLNENSTLDLSGSESSTDSEDFVEVEPLELEGCSQEDNLIQESNAFLESIEMPYDTAYSLNISMEMDNQVEKQAMETEERALTTKISLSQVTEFVENEPTNSEHEPPKTTEQVIDLDTELADSTLDNKGDRQTPPPLAPPVEPEQVQVDNVAAQGEAISVEPITVEDLVHKTQESNKLSRQAASVTQQMVLDCQELLRLFGVPWVVAPAEAEAQCAALEQLGLCDGVITDDSDIFLFGGNRVLRHFFTNSKMITQYTAEDLQKFFGLTRSKLICLGMLCGTDYTLGIDGIGPVTGLEVLSEFGPGEDVQPLVKFAEWYRSKLYSPGASSKPENAIRAKLLKFVLPQTFPSRVIFDAYYNANVDNSQETFSWASPQLSELRNFAKSKFGWSEAKSDALLLPVLKNLNEKQVQSRIDFFFSTSSKNSSVTEKLNIKRSKRLNEAIRRNLNQQTTGESEPRSGAKRRKKHAPKRNKAAPSTSKQSDTLVLSEDSSSDSN